MTAALPPLAFPRHCNKARESQCCFSYLYHRGPCRCRALLACVPFLSPALSGCLAMTLLAIYQRRTCRCCSSTATCTRFLSLPYKGAYTNSYLYISDYLPHLHHRRPCRCCSSTTTRTALALPAAAAHCAGRAGRWRKATRALLQGGRKTLLRYILKLTYVELPECLHGYLVHVASCNVTSCSLPPAVGWGVGGRQRGRCCKMGNNH